DGPRRRRQCARARPRGAVGRHRPGAPEALSLLWHGCEQPPLRQARCHGGRDVGGTARGAGGGLRRGHARWPRRDHRAGRNERLRRPAPAFVDRASARPQRNSRRADGRLSDLRRDRRVADRRGACRMTVTDRNEELRDIPAETRRPNQGGFRAIGTPTERSNDFGSTVRRLWQLLAPERPRLAFIAVTALATTILNVLGPRVLGRGTD